MRSDPVRGAAAGAAGGVLAGGVKLLWEAAVPPRPPDRKAPPVLLVDRALRERTGARLQAEDEAKASLAVHVAFCAVVGAAYGVCAEYVPRVRAGAGIAFGAMVWFLAHEIALPALGLAPPLPRTSRFEQANELASHALFGATLESIRAIGRG